MAISDNEKIRGPSIGGSQLNPLLFKFDTIWEHEF